MSVKIIVDSTTDLLDEIKERVTIVPLTIRFGDTEYIHGVELSTEGFYEKLIESDIMPTTSQASPDTFERVYKEATSNGDEVLVITLSSNLSGTYQSAVIAAEEFAGKVYVVDSSTVAIGTGILTEYALRLADEGKSAMEIATELNNVKDNICVIALLDTLEYLKKGGRISKTAAIAGAMLSIKPVINIVDGVVNMLGKARGSKQGNNLLVKEIEDAGGVNFDLPVLLGYTGLSDHLLNKYIEDSAFLWKGHDECIRTTIIGAVIGTHAGPGAVAAAFFKNNK